MSWIQNDEQKHFWSGNTFQEGLNEEIFSLHLKRDNVYALCFLDKKKFLISYGEIVLTELSKGILCRVIIKPEKRRMGIGKIFVNHLLNWAFYEKSVHKIILNTFGHNIAARRCYQSVGFYEVALKKRFRRVGNKWRDLVVMEKNSSTD